MNIYRLGELTVNVEKHYDKAKLLNLLKVCLQQFILLGCCKSVLRRPSVFF